MRFTSDMERRSLNWNVSLSQLGLRMYFQQQEIMISQSKVIRLSATQMNRISLECENIGIDVLSYPVEAITTLINDLVSHRTQNSICEASVIMSRGVVRIAMESIEFSDFLALDTMQHAAEASTTIQQGVIFQFEDFELKPSLRKCISDFQITAAECSFGTFFQSSGKLLQKNFISLSEDLGQNISIISSLTNTHLQLSVRFPIIRTSKVILSLSCNYYQCFSHFLRHGSFIAEIIPHLCR